MRSRPVTQWLQRIFRTLAGLLLLVATATAAHAQEAVGEDPDAQAGAATDKGHHGHGGGVQVTLDPAHATQKRIPPSGGTLQVTTASGVAFVLTLPPQSLLTPQIVTLTAVKTAKGLPFNLVGAVEVGPPGLRFGAAATLAIRPPVAVPLAQETTFGYRGGGAQMFLFPALLGQRPVTLALQHAGGYGLASATAAQQAAQLAKQPTRLEDQFDQGLWKSHWQQRQTLPPASASSEAAARWAPTEVWPGAQVKADATYYQSQYGKLEKLLDEIASSCAARKLYGYEANTFVADATTDGVASDLAGAVKVALQHGDARCYETATSACKGGDHTQVVSSLQWWGQLIVDGGTYLVDSGALESCLTFDFEWDTLLLHSNPAPDVGGGTYLISASHRLDTKTRVHFHVTGAEMPMGVAPPAPNNYVDAKWLGGAPKTCTNTATGVRDPDLFQVQSMIINANRYEDSPPPPTVDVVYGTGDPKMELNEVCSGQSHEQMFGFVAPAYQVLHLLEDPVLVSPWHPNELNFYEPVPETWKVSQGALWATRSYSDIFHLGDMSAQESTELNIFHRPGQL